MPETTKRRKPRTSVTADQARDDMKDVLNRAEFGGERVIITRHGKPAAAVVSIDDLEKIEAA